MKIAVISDIHSNKDAFSAVLEDIDTSCVDGIVSLGDNIGYGPEPEEVIHMIREREIPCVLGNHELALLDNSFLDWFNPCARDALIKNISLLSNDSISFIKRLKPSLQVGGYYYVHGFPPNSMTTYSFQVKNAYMAAVIRQMRSDICFVGHTHDLNIARLNESELIRNRLDQGFIELDPSSKFLVNVGSVGQPRSFFDKRANYVIADDEAHTLEVRFVAYDPRETVFKIHAAGIAGRYADCLLSQTSHTIKESV